MSKISILGNENTLRKESAKYWNWRSQFLASGGRVRNPSTLSYSIGTTKQSTLKLSESSESMLSFKDSSLKTKIGY